MAAACALRRLAPLHFTNSELSQPPRVASSQVLPVAAISRKNAVVVGRVGRSSLLGKGQIGRSAIFDPIGQHLVKKGLKQERAAVQMQASGTGASSTPEPLVASSAETPPLVLGGYFVVWYILNVFFNILNKQLYGYFPFPWFVSTVHLAVGVLYCTIAWGLGLPKRVELNGDEIRALVPISASHAVGHLMTNVSFATVAVSFTHTIKALEPFFSAVGQYLVFGETISAPLLLSLLPIVGGVSAASMTELSFNWTGFTGAMLANFMFTYRNLLGKKAMIKKLDSTNLYAYMSIIALICCIPATIIMEGKILIPGIKAAINKVGAQKFIKDLLLVGFFYHTYNQVQFNCLEKVNPVTHAVGNVAKRIFVIGFSLLVFKNPVTKQTAVGTAVAIAGCALYSLLKAKEKEEALKAKAA